jgi:hypothetical protein
MKQQFSDNTLQEVRSVLVAREVPAEERIIKRRIGFFTGDENHVITLEEGIELTRNYRKTAGKDAVKGGYFGREIIEKILAQRGCVGIRLYHGTHQSGKPTFVLSGVETNGNDLYQGVLGQEMRLSSPMNSNPNPLNSDSWKKGASVKRETKVFTGSENHFVTLAEASEYTRNYRMTMKEGDSKARFFGSSIFRKILAQSDCVGIRVYHARHDDGSPSSVLVGVDQYGNDFVSGVVAQKAMDCPPWCPVVNPLNR